jgi:hypothetical protein
MPLKERPDGLKADVRLHRADLREPESSSQPRMRPLQIGLTTVTHLSLGLDHCHLLPRWSEWEHLFQLIP